MKNKLNHEQLLTALEVLESNNKKESIMDVNIKRLRAGAVVPSYSYENDGCLDLFAAHMETKGAYTEYFTGLAFEIPKGYVGLVFPRSSISGKSQSLSNAVGVIDCGYVNEVSVRMRRLETVQPIYEIGDRVAQIMIIERPKIRFVEVDELAVSGRGLNGYGSTGDKEVKK